MRYIQELDNPENVRILVMQDLKELGIKVPKLKKNKSGKDDPVTLHCQGIFGNYLHMLPYVMVTECGPVPRFLVQATRILDKHIDIEGLFRKSGSVARQKELKIKIESGEDLEDANPLDMASLIKQFFRELPEPLFTSRLHDTFLKCYSQESEDVRVTVILLLCHQLPWHHLSTLRYVMLFLQKVAHNCDLNKMDIANLAVCVTPNLMHQGRSDKMNSESRLLQVQTSIVQLLILWAGDIGMVPDSLYERAVLMSTCFPTDDELEKSEAVHEENNKVTKKKKRRSGSLQGLVNNLSSSFSKWRKDGKTHNASSISDRSSMSYMSFEKSSMTNLDQAELSRLTLPPGANIPDDYLEQMQLLVEATPKVIRKRKAEDEAVPFSASKKKAILQYMPQMATLGSTPFTPTARRARYPGDFLDSPNIKFAEGENMVFNGCSTPNLQTPRRKMDKLFSPYTATKVKRQSSGKSGCFSPKSSKSNVRKSVRGFFRRLSGGKEQQSPGGTSHCSDGSQRSIPDSLHIMDPGAGQKKRTFFRNHKKTPSSPARLVTNLPAELQREKVAMASRGSSASSVKQEDETDCSFSIAELDKTPVVINGKMHKSNMSLDAANTSLKRGKPNNVRSGLQEYHKRRSFDVGDPCLDEHKTPVESVRNTIDTSPILQDGDQPLRSTPREMDMDCGGTPKSSHSGGMMSQSVMSRQDSTTSIMSAKLNESIIGGPVESGLDQAFINESCLVDMTHPGESNNQQGANDVDMDDVFSHDENSDDDSAEQYSVKYKCMEISPGEVTCGRQEMTSGEESNHSNQSSKGQTGAELKHQRSIESLDSALSGDMGPEPLLKSVSLHSIQSCDSGLGESKDLLCDKLSGKLSVKSDSSLMAAQLRQKLGDSFVTSHAAVSVKKSVDSRRRSFEPNLPISSGMNHMLSNAGKLDEAADAQSAGFRTSVRDLSKAGNMSSQLQQVNDQAEAEVNQRKESALRFPNSNMRRPRNPSPVRIPTIFAKADKEANHYRDLAKAALTSNSKTANIRKPNLPLTNNLIRTPSIRSSMNMDSDKTPELTGNIPDDLAGNTPAHYPNHSALRVINFDSVDNKTLKEHNGANMTLPTDIVPSTPKIKPSLLSDKNTKLLNKTCPSSGVTSESLNRYRTPMKPVKRLQGTQISPHSRRLSRSPKSTSPRKPGSAAGHRMSPVPAQNKDWNI